jgi:hypothetical protein
MVLRVDVVIARAWTELTWRVAAEMKGAVMVLAARVVRAFG